MTGAGETLFLDLLAILGIVVLALYLLSVLVTEAREIRIVKAVCNYVAARARRCLSEWRLRP
jgi:hypothetical protein